MTTPLLRFWRALAVGLSVFANVRAVRTVVSGSLASVRNGGEGWGEDALRKCDTVRLGGARVWLKAGAGRGGGEPITDEGYVEWGVASDLPPHSIIPAPLTHF